MVESVADIPKESAQLALLKGLKWSPNMNPAAQPTKLPVNNSVVESNHTYYTSYHLANLNKGSKYFRDLKGMMEANNSDVKGWSFKSGTRGAIGFFVDQLKFVFPFYGHEVSQVVVTSAGFLHVGQIIHNLAHDVHYIAPLMANFTPTGNRTTTVYTYDDGSRYTVQWDSVYESEKNTNDSFTFQVSLFKDGTIYFSYQNIPHNVSEIPSKYLKKKVGLADGYIYTVYIRYMGRPIGPFRIIYKYHTLELKQSKIVTNSAFILTPVPNCISAKSCSACFSKRISSNFKCKWCEKLQLCSDTIDWHQQRWVLNGCPQSAVDQKLRCYGPPSTVQPSQKTTNAKKGDKGKAVKPKEKNKPSYAGIIIGVLVLIVVLLLISVCVYGYRHPSSKIGLFMIENRPSRIFGRL